MANLLIVESPTKVKTLAAFLGDGWIVEASRGHVRDLPEAELGVDVQGGFALHYKVLSAKNSVLGRLRRAIQAADAVYLATDPDREGEAIAWHILELAKAEAKGKPLHRITFTAITQSAVLGAIASPRRLDMALVEAQQTRRAVDRLVGYLVSPLACKALNSRVSAGRVQSVCLRLVVEREREMVGFRPTIYQTLAARLKAPEMEFVARLASIQGKKANLRQKEQVGKLLRSLTNASFWVGDVKRGEKMRHPLSPFTTSSLQQAASKALGLSPEQTMQMAQALYEAGRITYLRTDSVAVDPGAQACARQHIRAAYGGQYVPALPQVYASKIENAQEAHEAIHPVEVSRLPGSVSGEGAALYDLIWQRFMASQMADARYLYHVAQILAGKTPGQRYPLEFQARGRSLRFDGFLKVYEEALDDGEEAESDSVLPPLTPGQSLSLAAWLPEAHTTRAPARYTEASLIQALETRGIGRPSTYASMVKTVKDKGYVRLDKKRLVPTDLGLKLCDFLVQHFPVMFDFAYTAALEQELDQVASGKATRPVVLGTFWKEQFVTPLKALAAVVAATLPPQAPKVIGVCPKCGGNLVERRGSKGSFAGCENFPKCRGTAQPVRFAPVPKGAKA